MIATLWRVSENFDRRRNELVTMARQRLDPPRAEVLASVARGLLEQGLVDDGLVLAALAIESGEQADVNSVGASALGVLFDPLLALDEMRGAARMLLYGP